jgi:hypothetical protein
MFAQIPDRLAAEMSGQLLERLGAGHAAEIALEPSIFQAPRTTLYGSAGRDHRIRGPCTPAARPCAL